MLNKRGQLTIFIIVAVVLIAAVGLFFTLKDRIDRNNIPATFEPAYNTFISCLEENTHTGINLLEAQAGYIEKPEFEAGSTYMPFSSQLDLYGVGVPYWYYVSGNNIERQRVPSKIDMQNQLAEFIQNKMNDCDFSSFYDEGFEIEKSSPSVEVTIKNSNVDVRVTMNLAMSNGEESMIATAHRVTVDSKLGELYDSARKIYNEEQKNLFLEEYAIDTLRLYAPVDGVDISCAPRIWNADEVFDDLQTAVQDNTQFLRVKNGDYVLNDDNNKYFVLDFSSNSNVRFVTSKNWPSSYEVSPNEGNLLMANPVGNQPELGALGFCYVPHHFVYSMKYPVLVQVYEGTEVFQFPLAVVIQGNKPREALNGIATSEVDDVKLCDYKNTPVGINVRGSDGNLDHADIYYECFGDLCSIGESPLYENFPQCANGYVIAKADGYEESKRLFSTVSPGTLDMTLYKLYEKNIDLKIDGMDYSGSAIITFVSGDKTKTVVYPEQRSVQLSSGSYDVTVYVYGNVSINFGSSTYKQCVQVPASGIAGMLGRTSEECYDLNIPESSLSNALTAGGSGTKFFSESDLMSSGGIEIDASSLPNPTTINQVQENYILFENGEISINLE